MLPPATSVVVGATIEKKFPGYGVHRGTVAEIDGGKARYTDANGKEHAIGYYDTQEDAAHAVNAAIRRAGLEGRRHTNPVVDGQLVPKKRKATGHGPPRKSRARRRR